jgi:hypothetical protein
MIGHENGGLVAKQFLDLSLGLRQINRPRDEVTL